MANVYEGALTGHGKSVAVVVARFNEFVTNKLLGGAIDILSREGVDDKDIDVFYVPGAFEIPSLASKLAQNDKYDGILCLGAVIRGATPHFEYVSSEVSKGIAQVALNAKAAVTYGVITADTIEQAIERAGTKMGNRGADAAMSLLELMNLYSQVEGI